MGHAAGQCCQWLPTAAASAVEGKRVARILWTYVGSIYLVVVDVWSQAHRRLFPRTLTQRRTVGKRLSETRQVPPCEIALGARAFLEPVSVGWRVALLRPPTPV